jgi:hypothetical protein
MLKDKRELEENLINVLQDSKLKTKKKIVNDIKIHLASNYEIISAQGWINDPETKLPELDVRELFLFTEQVFSKTEDPRVNPQEFFTQNEIKESRQYSGLPEQDIIEFPITIPNVLQISNEEYVTMMDTQMINKLMKSNKIYYNFDVQREAKIIKRKDKVIFEPTLHQKNVKEITNNLLNDEQFTSELTFNAATRTSDTGNELIYDAKHLELTITHGTRIDIVDGFHRCKAIENAMEINPDLIKRFTVKLTNFSTRMVQKNQAQIAKASHFSTTRIQELEGSRFSDDIVRQLKLESELKGRVSQTNRIHSINRELVTYNVLADTIDEEFKMETKLDSMDVADYLCKFFDYLIGSHPSEFINNVEETRKTSLINENSMFVGYITLARRLYESNTKAKEVVRIIKDIDFNKNNSLWKELDILNEKNNLTETNKSRKAIREYFENVDIGIETKK